MFQVGQRVVCVNDYFAKPLVKDYTALPVKGVTYTIRAVYVGRNIRHPAKAGDGDGEIGVLLVELLNPVDSRSKYQHELGFKAERFSPLEELTETSTERQPEVATA